MFLSGRRCLLEVPVLHGPLVADSLGDWDSAVEVVHKLFLVLVDQDSCVVVTLGNVQWLKLATAYATEGKPDKDVSVEATVLYQVHNRAEGGSFHDIIAEGGSYYQAVWTVVCYLAEGRRFTATNLNH